VLFRIWPKDESNACDQGRSTARTRYMRKGYTGFKQKNSYMTGELCIKWFENVFLYGLRERQMSLPHQLLIFDCFSGHLSSNFKQRTKAENIPIAVIPGGLTKECQPLDIGINRSFKAQFRKLWTRWIQRLYLPSTKGGKIKAIEIDELAHLV
jgi:hypothetical protein